MTLTNADMGYLYRKSNGPRGAVFTSAVYQGFPGEPEQILDRDARNHRKARKLAADPRQDRRLDLQESRRPFELEADR